MSSLQIRTTTFFWGGEVLLDRGCWIIWGKGLKTLEFTEVHFSLRELLLFLTYFQKMKVRFSNH